MGKYYIAKKNYLVDGLHIRVNIFKIPKLTTRKKLNVITAESEVEPPYYNESKMTVSNVEKWKSPGYNHIPA